MSTQADNRFYRENIEHNPLQVALDNYHMMEAQRDSATDRASQLNVANGSLVAEVHMLREQLAVADADRIRLQAVASTLLGRLLGINDCIAGAVKAAVKDGIDATAPKDDPEPARPEPASLAQRVAAARPPETAEHREAPVGAPLSPLRILGSTPLPPPAGLMRTHLR